MAKVVATQTFHVGTKGGTVTIVKGQHVDAKKAIVKNAAPGLFVPTAEFAASVDPVVHRAVEAATAAPGETRAVKKPAPKKKAAAKK